MAGADLTEGQLVANIVHFAQALRKAGVRVGSAQVTAAVRAVAAIGFSDRADFHAALRATLITRRADQEVFDQAFGLFWRDPDFLNALMHRLSPVLGEEPAPTAAPDAAERRAREALAAPPAEDPAKQPAKEPPEEVVANAAFTRSEKELLGRKDFAQMSAEELAEAAAILRQPHLPLKPVRLRRLVPSARGARPDARATLRHAMRQGGEITKIARKAPAIRPPDLVVLCDISGSMAVYSRLLLRYLHALCHAGPLGGAARVGQITVFTFGTRLTNISRALQKPDPDAALAAAGALAQDWEGGTQIGTCLAAFNRDWARRVLSAGAEVLLITDGLERDDLASLRLAMRRLARRARHLRWLNPLLRWEGFEPKAGGMQVILGHADSLHACHSLDSLADLAAVLRAPGPRR